MQRMSCRMGVVLMLVGFGAAMAGELADLRCSASAPKTRYALGEDIPVEVVVKNLDAKPTTVRELKLGRNFLEFEITVGKDKEAKLYRYTRILGRVRSPDQPGPVELPGGKELKFSLKIPAVIPGPVRIVGVLWGKIQLDAIPVVVEGEGKSVGFEIQTDKGTMKARLLPELAPNTVTNLVRLAKDGYYDGLFFHRVMKGFMIQGGDPKGDGSGGPGFMLPAEFNEKLHEKGVLSMARRDDHVDTAGSQFFLMHARNQGLDRQYSVFGELVSGVDVLDTLANTPVVPDARGEMSKPKVKPKLSKVTVITLPEK